VASTPWRTGPGGPSSPENNCTEPHRAGPAPRACSARELGADRHRAEAGPMGTHDWMRATSLATSWQGPCRLPLAITGPYVPWRQHGADAPLLKSDRRDWRDGPWRPAVGRCYAGTMRRAPPSPPADSMALLADRAHPDRRGVVGALPYAQMGARVVAVSM